MMNEVTDSSLIAELEGNSSGLKPVDNPALIQELEGMPQQSKGISDETLSWNIMQDYFDKPKEEVSKIWDSFVISEAFKDKGLKRGMTYDYYDIIKKAIDDKPDAADRVALMTGAVSEIIDIISEDTKTDFYNSLSKYNKAKQEHDAALAAMKELFANPPAGMSILGLGDVEKKINYWTSPASDEEISKAWQKNKINADDSTLEAMLKGVKTYWVDAKVPLHSILGLARGMIQFPYAVLEAQMSGDINKRAEIVKGLIDFIGRPTTIKDFVRAWVDEGRLVPEKFTEFEEAWEKDPFGSVMAVMPFVKGGFKTFVDTAKPIAKASFEVATKDTLTRYNLPKTITIDAADLKVELQTGGVLPVETMQMVKDLGITKNMLKEGLRIEIPAEKIIINQDKPYFSKIKSLFNIEPYSEMMKEYAGIIKKDTIGLLSDESIVSTKETIAKPYEASKTIEKPITTEQPVKTEGLQIADLEKMFEQDKSPEEFMQMLEGKKTEALTSEAISELPLKEALLKEPSAEKQEAPTLLEVKHEEVFSKNIDDISIEEAKYRLTHDKLTGLKNREAFEKEGETPYMGMLDLDGFKQINDTFGHGAGDALLKEFAKKAQEKLGDKLYRLHGDEHAFKAMSEEEGYAIAKELDNIGKSATIVVERQGTKYLMEGVEFSYGIGKDFREADAKLYEHKAVREREGSRIPGSFPEGVRFVPPTEWSGRKWSEIQDKLQREQKDLKKSHLTFLKDWLKTKEGPQKLKYKDGEVAYQGKSDREQIFQDLSKEYKYSYDQIQNLLDRAINDKPLIDKPKTPASLEKANQFIEDILAKTKDLYVKSEGGFLTSPETKTFKPKPIQQDMIGAKTGLEGKLPSEEIKGKTDLEVATEQAQIREAQKGQGDIILESGGLQTLYETLMKKAKVPETAYSDIVELGKYVYEKGGNTASSWMKGMKEHLGKLWDTYKEFLTKVWNEIKKFVGNEKGFVRFGKEQPGDIKLSELDKQDELFKVGILEAYKAGKEAYKAGLKTGIQKEHAKIMELQKQKKLHEAIKAEAKDMVNDIKDIQENIKNTHPIAADAITKVLDSVDLSNISENKRAELEPLYAYYKSQEGMQIPENLIKPLSNLDKKPIKDLTLDELRDIHSAVMEAAKLGEKLERQEATYENVINRLSKIKPSVAVSYQKMIKETLVDFDPKKMSEQTMQELQKTKDYLDNVNPEEIGMSQETYSKLKKSTERLNKKRLADMTLDEKKELAETLQRLNAQGKVMRQLELARRERTKQELLKTLLDDTSTLDPKKDTTFRKGGKELYQKTLTSYRVADNIDNFIEGGINKQFIADQLIKETESDYTSYEQNAKFIEKAKAIKPEWTEEEQQRVVVKALDIMDAKTQRDMLIEELGMKEIPILTEVENKLLLLVEETMNQNKHDISATFEYRENQIFPEIKRYIFPLKYEAQKNLVNAEILRHDYHKTKQVDDYFTEQRAKGVKKLIRTDLFNIVRQSLEEQNWYINMQPTLDTQASVLFTKEYKVKAGEMGYNWWKDQIDIVARRGYSAKSDTMFRNGEKYLKEKRINLNNAIMTYKVSSAVMQIFSVFDGMATALALQKPGAAATMIPNVIAAWLKKPEIIKMSKALQMRTGGEQALREIVDQGFKNKLTEWGYVPLKNADLRTASGVMKSFYNSLEGKGADKIQQAELLMALSQGGNAISLRPHILASGEIARTAFTFQTFFLNRWGLVANDIINRGIIHGDAKTKSYAVAALATIIIGSILEDEVRESLWTLISGKKPKKEVAPVKKVLANLIETVPLAGRAMSSTIQGRRGDTDVPIVRLGKQGFGGIWDVLSKEKSKDKVKGAIKAIEMILSVRYGMPATAQIMDFIEGAMNDRK